MFGEITGPEGRKAFAASSGSPQFTGRHSDARVKAPVASHPTEKPASPSPVASMVCPSLQLYSIRSLKTAELALDVHCVTSGSAPHSTGLHSSLAAKAVSEPRLIVRGFAPTAFASSVYPALHR